MEYTAKRKSKKSLISCFIFFALLIAASIILFHFKSFKPVLSELKANEEEKQKELVYNQCINQNYSEEELTETLLAFMKDIDSYIDTNHFSVSVYYEDINTGFHYEYNANKVYYGCSLIKLVDALYLIEKAMNDEINLDEVTVVYESKYKMDFSLGMEKHIIGEEVSLRDLITYAISLSDNSAHLMLIDYIGFENLKAYGQSLGAKVILTGGDLFGNQTVLDTNVYLKKAYQIISENSEYGTFLKNLMDNNERNAFNTEEVKIYHKYGSYGLNFHDIGLSLEEHPYTISIFTLHEGSNYLEVIQGIHSKIRLLHKEFYENRKNHCYEVAYN